jgi:hypothetical protein
MNGQPLDGGEIVLSVEAVLDEGVKPLLGVSDAEVGVVNLDPLSGIRQVFGVDRRPQGGDDERCFPRVARLVVEDPLGEGVPLHSAFFAGEVARGKQGDEDAAGGQGSSDLVAPEAAERDGVGVHEADKGVHRKRGPLQDLQPDVLEEFLYPRPLRGMRVAEEKVGT